MICWYIDSGFLCETYQCRVHIKVLTWRIVEHRCMVLNFVCAPLSIVTIRYLTMSLINLLYKIN